MTIQEIIKLQSLLCKMKQGPYEYWNEPGNDILAAGCKEGDGEPIAALPGIHTLPDEFRAIAALLNAAPELIRLALLAKHYTNDGPREGRFVKTRECGEGKIMNLERQPGLVSENAIALAQPGRKETPTP